MAEGGQLPWKRQTIDQSHGPAADYSQIQRPIALPGGMKWSYNAETREWRAIKAPTEESAKAIDATTTPVTKSGDETSAITNTETTSAPVQGQDYVLHTILPQDTFAGLCLRYGCKALDVRRANQFTGNNLKLAPSAVLVIPLRQRFGLNGRTIRAQDRSSPDYKIHSFLAELPKLRSPEARSYLDMADWDLEQALGDAREDLAWEQEQQEEEKLEHEKKLQLEKKKKKKPDQEKQRQRSSKNVLPALSNTTSPVMVDTAIPLFSICLAGKERKYDTAFAPVDDTNDGTTDEQLRKPLLLEMGRRDSQ